MKNFKRMDKTILALTILFTVLGLIMIFSASSASTILRYRVPSYHFFQHQLYFVAAGIVASFIILKIPTSKYKGFAYLGVLGVLMMLVYVLINGKVNHNAQSWIPIGGFSIQPAEFAKSVLIVFMSVFYNNLHVKKDTTISKYLIPVAIAIIMAVLICMQPDFGSAFIFLLIAFFIFISVPFVIKNFQTIFKIGIVGLILGVLVLSLSGRSLLSSERLSRFDFKSPCTRYKENTGYQVCNGLIAISSGGLFGRGLGNSTQKFMYLPESHTDFIFPIIIEELGSIVGAIIILGYGLLLMRIYKIAKEASNLQSSIIAYGTFWYFAIHIIVNLLGILAMMPLTGVPLPFLSYGGSFTINAYIMLACTQRIAIENNKDRLARQMAKL